MYQNNLLQLLGNKALFADDLDNALEQLLPLVALAMQVDRVNVWGDVDASGVSLSLKNYDATTQTFTQGIPIVQKHTLGDHWQQGYKLLCIPDMRASGIADRFTDEYFQQHDIGAVLAVPILIKGKRRGLVVVEQLSVPLEWREEHKQYLLVISCILALIIENDQIKRIAAELSERKTRLSLSQKFANIGTWDWNIQTGEVFWSEQVAPMFGYSYPVLETTADDFMTLVHPQDRDKINAGTQACIQDGDELDIVYRVVWQDGSVHWLHESGDVERDGSGAAIRMLGVVRDVTLRQEYETALLEARDAAESANAAKSEFLSRMSHELRTPLNAILGFCQLLEMNIENNLSDNQFDNLGEIRRAGKHLLNLINEVLDLAKIEAGHTDLSLEPLRIKDIFRDSLVLVAGMFEQRNITVRNLWETLPDASVIADRTRTKQVLVNLLSNAAKYAKHGAIVEVGFERCDEHRLRCFVKDDGPGIAESRQAELFQAFSRLDQEHSQVEGTGIGLLISKKIIEQMSGRMGVDSQLGVGSCFWFELVLISQLEEPEHQANMTTQRLWQKLSGFGETRRILYVEDNPSNVRLVEQIIAKIPDTELVTTNDPEQGLELANSETLHMILLDLHFAGISGYELLGKMRNIHNLGAVPIVAVSANAMDHDRERVQQAGFDGYVTKPFSVSEFVDTLYQHLKK